MPSQLMEDYNQGKKFWLGPVVRIHTIGDYAFLEYEEKIFPPNEGAGGLSGRNCFSLYHIGKRLSISCSSLDEAMLCSVANHHGQGSAVVYIKNMLGMI